MIKYLLENNVLAAPVHVEIFYDTQLTLRRKLLTYLLRANTVRKLANLIWLCFFYSHFMLILLSQVSVK